MKDDAQPIYSTQRILQFQLKHYRNNGWLVFHLFLKFGRSIEIADRASGWLLTDSNPLLSEKVLPEIK